MARLNIAAIPDGVYRFTDHIDGLGEDPEPIVLQVALIVEGDSIIADWEGTSAQVRGGINAPLSFTKSNVYAALRSIMPQEMPNCHGYTRPITVRAPEGTLVNCVSPAPCGARGITGYRIVDCMFGALAPALPDRLTADGARRLDAADLRRHGPGPALRLLRVHHGHLGRRAATRTARTACPTWPRTSPTCRSR